jgi:isopenicillin N synthase-like dioxygenase
MSLGLPIVDIAPLVQPSSPDDEKRAAGALYDALSSTGFAILTGHGVPESTIEDMRRAVRDTFDTPREVLALDTVVKGNYRGYVPLGYFTPNSGKGKGDQYEAWKLHNETSIDDPIRAECHLYGPNVWPRIDADVRGRVMTYWNAMTKVCDALIVALCSAMRIEPERILSAMDKPLTNMTLLNYPPTDPQPDTWGIHPHKDFNVLTILAHDPVGGLEVRTRDDQWIDAKCPPGALVLNVGDMLELWSGGRLISTPHRVTNTSGGARQSFPFFYKPRHDVVVEPLVPALEGFDRLPLNVGASAADIWYSNWPDTASTEPAQVLGDYAN